MGHDNYQNLSALKVSEVLADFLNNEVLPGLDIMPDDFWSGFSELVKELAPTNAALLKKRDNFQNQIDVWEKSHKGEARNEKDYISFLQEIGYIEADGGPCAVETTGVDIEISKIAGPQLVVPVTNARYALNAANSRWGSLYDALYGTDVIPMTTKLSSTFNVDRGAKVVAWGRSFLDQTFPLSSGSYIDITGFVIDDAGIQFKIKDQLIGLQSPEQFVGIQGDISKPSVILLCNHGLHAEIIIDSSTPVGSSDLANISDIILEAALSTILDFEDSVAVVDAQDKVVAYKNWLGLMKADLTESFKKGETTVHRCLNEDRSYSKADGSKLRLQGRALMLVRNVGHLMTTPAILDSEGKQIPEGILDGVVTSLIALYDLKKDPGFKTYNSNDTKRDIRNSRSGSIYIVKPKMHGSREVAFACTIFDKVEALLGLAKNTIKIGIMDEERRTSANLKECIRAAKSRIFFINTGFLDRTGDEIHTSNEAGAVVRKAEMKNSVWIKSYEDRNVDIGLRCGLKGKAQIGKGMWAMPDLMADMIEKKIEHPLAGANTAWVPSPTAATLHATHYHQVDIFSKQDEILNRDLGALSDLLTVPLAIDTNWPDDDIEAELDNNAQSILGYVVRWIDQGVGCSKVPDIHDIGLMEDRATLRISSQHMANWLKHGIVSEEKVMETMRRMAKVVDQQNETDPSYVAMSGDYEGIAFKAACDLVFLGAVQPSGYTEPILHQRRLEQKALANNS